MKKKKIFGLLFGVLLMTNTLFSNVSTYSNPYDNLGIETVLKGFTSDDYGRFSGDLGKLTNMSVIIKQSIWIDFIIHDENNLVSELTKDYYIEDFNFKVGVFNETYDDLNIALNDDGEVDLAVTFSRFAKVYETYIKSLLDTGLSENELIDKYDDELEIIYKGINYIESEVDTINSYLPVKEVVEDGITYYETENPYDISIAINPLYQLLEGEEDDVSRLIRMALDITEQEVVDILPNRIDNDIESLFLRFLDGDGERLNDVFNLIFSASALYEPFMSTVGESTFLKGLEEVSGSNYDNIKEFYMLVKDYKKPLYLVDETGKNGGSTMVSASEFIDLIQDKDTNSFAVLKGEYKQDTSDSNSYNIYNQNRFEQEEGLDEGLDDDGELKEDSEDFINFNTPVVDRNRLTEPVLITGDNIGHKKMSVDSVYIRNNIAMYKDIENFQKDKSLVFVNVFGDIVTEDGIVIIPGATNSTYLAEDEKYYPYTFGFMKSYPSVNKNLLEFEVSNKQDEDKYIVIMNSDSENRDINYIAGNEIDREVDINFVVRQLDGDNGIKNTQYYLEHSFYTDMINFTGSNNSTMFGYKHFEFSSLLDNMSAGNGINPSREYIMIKELYPIDVGGERAILFDTDLEDMNDTMLGLVVKNYYWSLMGDTDGNMLDSPNGRLDDEFMQTVVNESLNGLKDSMSFSRNTFDYGHYLENQYGMIFELFKDLTTSFVKLPLDLTGVLGMENAVQNPIFGNIIRFYDNYLVQIVIFMIFMVLVKYMTKSVSLVSVLILIIILVFSSEFFVKILPSYIPNIYNISTEVMSKDLGYVGLLINTDNYASMMNDDTDIDTMSVDLYKLDDLESDELIRILGVEEEDLLNKRYNINSNTGLYVEGDILKLNLDEVYGNFSITGSYMETELGVLNYQYKLEKMQSDSIDYYMPYYLINQSFVEQINKLNTIYEIPRTTIRYRDMTKDSFMVSSYINSPPFLDPGNYDNYSSVYNKDTIDKLNLYFGESDDWLGLSSFLTKPLDNGEDSLWYETMINNGYIHKDMFNKEIVDSEAIKSREKLNELIYQVNLLTKEFVITNEDSLYGMSDENLIKTISLHATLIFNQKVSDYWSNLYPMFLNIEEMTLHDVFNASYMTGEDRFLVTDNNIVEHVSYEMEIIGMLLLTLVVWGTALTTIAVKLLIPLLYALSLLFIIVKFMINSDIGGILRGLFKTYIILFIVMSTNVIGFYLVYKVGLNYISLIIHVFISMLNLFILFNVLKSVVLDIWSMGDNKYKLPVNVKITGASNLRFNPLGLLGGVKTVYNGGKGVYDKYKYEINTEDFRKSDVLFNKVMNEIDESRVKGTDEDGLDEYRNI